MAETIRKVAKETLRVSTGKTKVYKESWWWNEEVKKKIKDKNMRFKELMTCTEEEDRTHKKERYKEAKWAAKKAVAEAKDCAFKAFYQNLETKEVKKYICKLAKARSRHKKNLRTVKFITDEGGRVLLRQEDIKMRWHQYFSQLLNETRGLKENIQKTSDFQRTQDHGSIIDITTAKVGEALK
ncbi:uncharacterized protein LOC130797145 [Amaranthus tricolor]|uniref:uncharacterized protein LOC130797145 n=1 Tax=Amaranthus tricolor TaxID=29722 RepID=UPI00258FAB55|nr:uncharacterized protein LOC130797145 [Amaranthus tricolor]